jgi:two-component system sensor histidine kinase RegB
MAPFAGEPELREEIEEMQRQIERCKAIVSGILMSAGETRADAPVQTSLHAFLDGLAADWRRTRGSELEVDRDGVPDLPIISDTALAQMVGNVLDNALEAAPGAPIRLQALADADTLTLVVRDQGPGFAPTVLARLGTPYVSTKAKPGRGLGLFLAVNVARTLGGSLSAHNVPQGGAQVRIVLPLASLTPESPADDRT